MKMLKNKQGFIAIAIIVVLVIGAFVIYAITVSGKGATSLTPKVPGCKSPLLQAQLSGVVVIKDGALFGIEPEVEQIENVQLRSNPLKLEPFNYKITLIDDLNGNTLDSVQGNSNLDSKQARAEIPFNLVYKVPDQDCDAQIDDSRLKVSVTIKETKDVFEDSDTKEFTYNIAGGKIV
jgi:hypothetical protein